MTDENLSQEQPATPAPEPTPEVRKYKVKVDGAEAEVDETELVASYQKGRSADKRFQEAAELKKQVLDFVENIKNNPTELLSQLGHDPKEWARQLLLAEIEAEEALKDPNAKRIAGLEKKLQELENMESKKAQELKAKQEEAEIAATVEKIDADISETLVSLGFKQGEAPAELLYDLADQMLAEYKLSKRSMSAKEALDRTKSSYSKRLTAISKASPDAILELIPQEYLDKIAESYAKKRQPKTVPSVRTSTPAIGQARESEVKKELEEFFRRKS